MSRRASVNANLISKTQIGDVLGHTQQSCTQQVRVITLNKNQHLDSALFRVQKGWVLEFRLGPSLLGKEVAIWCNHPLNIEDDFIRKKFYKLDWQCERRGAKCSDSTAMFALLHIRRAGAFKFFFLCDEGTEREPNGSGYFVVDPVLPFGEANTEMLPLDCIQCQTVLSKSLGPFDGWKDRLRVSKESGYNMIHFTPIQELGDSNSSYSLKDQLKLNSKFNANFEEVQKLVSTMREEWKVLSLCDIVLNHTANESPWLIEHPECTYNMKTAPHLISAAILDAHLHLLTLDVGKGKLEDRGINREVFQKEHIEAIRWYLESELVPSLKLQELYTCDVEYIVGEFKKLAVDRSISWNNNFDSLKIIQDAEFRRGKSTVDLNLAVDLFNKQKPGCVGEIERVEQCAEDLRQRLRQLNEAITTEISHHLRAATGNCIAGMYYFRLQDDGPKLREVSERCPLVPRYFTGSFKDKNSIEEEIYSDAGRYVMAHNGWVMNSDALRNFAAPDSNVYIRRELIAWGDSVKLRFGDEPSDCPFLWQHMQKYVEQTALIFDGIRLDNCHATPIHVAEYLLDCARRVRPDLYIAAELFTNSDQTDNIFVNRLGITSLIREALSAWDSHEQGRLVYRYGGEPTGSFMQSSRRPLRPTIAHALFLDVTHDNPSPIQKRSVFDLIPSSALVTMACCASGSSRGYDELVPHHIHVVDEPRLYASWTCGSVSDASQVNLSSGIIEVKRALNELHTQLGREGFNQVFVDQMSSDVVAVTRHNPESLETVVLIAFTAFHAPQGAVPVAPAIRGLQVEGQIVEVLLEASLLSASPENCFETPHNFKKDANFINGLSNYVLKFSKNIPIADSQCLRQVSSEQDQVAYCEFKCFQPGSVVIVKIHPHPSVRSELERVTKLGENFLLNSAPEDLQKIVDRLNLIDLNHALYKCGQEERESEGDTFYIPDFGSLVYCGLQGFISVFSDIRLNNDLGHPICNNLRQGNWMLDYLAGRLKVNKGTHELGVWLEKQFDVLIKIPRYLIPRFFDVIVVGIYNLLVSKAAVLMSEFVREGSSFVRALALGSVQCTGLIRSAPLPRMSPNLENVDQVLSQVTLSAGLPHFSTGYMRSWGRDTFISLRGLFLLTGRFPEARYHILGFGSCLRHGLIPNLLDRGVNARYNCRDAVWWWLYSIVEYVKLSPNGEDILKDPVSRIFPSDDSAPLGPGIADMSLSDVMQEALQVHFEGLSFRERNAGTQIDAHMRDNGFNNRIGVDSQTGFVFGGNNDNCGTWMDKMGSSEKAGNKGQPATPRDGSAVEIIALSKAILRDLAGFYEKGFYPYDRVKKSDGTTWTLREWEKNIEENFEKYFWVPSTPQENESRPDLVHRRGIYKDSVGATKPWADYQLRCNFPIALVVAPEMVDANHAWEALEITKNVLLGPLGMKTLDPADWNYRGDYHNDNDSTDLSVAHGFNYHQGPEWLWPVGYFLRARLIMAKKLGDDTILRKTIFEIRSYLSQHYEELLTSQWRGLPELTNKDGSYCNDSCRTQAWSLGCILEVMYDLQQVES